jgi:recombination protein RecA
MAAGKGDKRPSLPAAKTLGAFSLAMQARYGKQRVSNGPPPVIVPTGSLSLDRALRVGGWQLGRVYEIIGPQDSGKSTLMIASMISHRSEFPGKGVCYVNMESTFDPERATEMGLDCSDAAKNSGTWLPLLPENSEDVSDMARDVVASGLYSCIVVDSIGAMESKKVLDKDAAEDTMGKNAGVITKMNKALATLARLNQCTVLLVNQPRANYSGYGGDVSAGPKHMRHVTTAKVDMSARGGEKDVRKIKAYPDDEDPVTVSQRHVARVSRMKNGLSGGSAQFFINKVTTDEYGPAGIDFADEYLTFGERAGGIKVGGSYYTFPDGRRVNGKAAAARYLRETPEALKAVREAMTFEEPSDDDLEGASRLCRQHRRPSRWARSTRSTWPGSTPAASRRPAGASGPTRPTGATPTTSRTPWPGTASQRSGSRSRSPWT